MVVSIRILGGEDRRAPEDRARPARERPARPCYPSHRACLAYPAVPRIGCVFIFQRGQRVGK